MTALAESAVAMNASLELVEVLQRILDQTAQALRVETVLLGLIDESGKQLEFRAATGNRPDHPVVGIHLPLGEGIAGRVAQSGQGIVVPNTQGSQVVQIPGIDIRALVCAPVQIQGKIIGVLEAINPLSGTFDADALFVLSGIGSLAGIAIHNAQLYGQVDQAHLRYHELFDDSIDPIIITDCLGKILEANRQATNTLGYSQAVLQQLNIGAIHQQMPSKTGKELEFIGEGDPISYESRLYTSGGTTVPIQVYARKVHMEGADCIQWILRDISERKDLDSLREDLIAMVYHDLRSPLANVVSSLDVMESMLPPQDGGSLSSVLNIAIRSTGRIQRLVNSLLDITRLESGQTLINQAPVDTHTLVADTLDAVQSLSKSKGQSIDINLPENLPNLWADEDMIRRVMVNLVENAVKFSPAKSHIEVGAQVAGNQVKFWVQDSGSGIPLELQDTIFEKFTRLHADSGTKGLGLGLAFCRLAIQAHGGKIWLESKPKAGSRFFFTLPAAPSEFPTPAQAA
jgi:PAS domain S-box-containing protein